VAFAGLAFWNPPIMTWQRHLDSMRDQISDSSRLHFEGDSLVESGCLKWAGLTIPFREEWRRMSGSQEGMSAQIDTDRIDITLGPGESWWRTSRRLESFGLSDTTSMADAGD
jgi:hypothetical protein